MLKKIIYDVSIVTHWMENPYLQDFTSEKAFQDLTWNLLNLISGVSKTENGTTTQLASYTWYADGTKYSAERPDGSGYVYKGNVIYERAANGDLTLDCVLTTGGRIVANKNSSGTITGYTVYHHITDHLGSVRAITDASTGTVVETSDYLPFGTRWSQTSGSLSATITDATNRWRYSGKEEQEAINPALPLIDYGARMYDPTIVRWMSTDPMAEKYYPVSPYNYCANSPLNLVDPEGMNPIYDKEGNFLGIDDKGLQGEAIVMEKENFTLGMSNKSALGSRYSGSLSKEVEEKIQKHFSNLSSRPDYDGFVTISEGIAWAKSHPGALENLTPDNMLYVDASKLDFGDINVSDFKNGEGKDSEIHLFSWGNPGAFLSPQARATTYALGTCNMTLIDKKRGAVSIVNDKATYYDWNRGGSFIRDKAVAFELNRAKIPRDAGFRVFYYGVGYIKTVPSLTR